MRAAAATRPPPASTTRSASMTRASSPPDAILCSGPAAAPGLVAISKLTRSAPVGPHWSSPSGSSRVATFAFSSLSGGSSLVMAASSALAALVRAAVRDFAAAA